MSGKEIYVSYAWKGESESMVEAICRSLADRGHAVVRDKTEMSYKDSIRAFMDRIGGGKNIIAVVSDRYMKSEYCMYEAYRMSQSPVFRRRVFPVVLPDADIFSFQGQAAYLKHWQAAYKQLESAYSAVAQESPTMAAPLAARLRDIEVTTRFINDFMAAVADMNVLTAGMHLESGFEALIAALEARMDDGDSRSETRDPEKTPVRVDTGGGLYIAGNVDTSGGDFVGRDNIVREDIPRRSLDPFRAIYDAIERHAELSRDDRTDLLAEIRELADELKRGNGSDESLLRRKLRAIQRLSPSIMDKVLDVLLDPASGFGRPARAAAEDIRQGGK
jgi:hypothetical protein